MKTRLWNRFDSYLFSEIHVPFLMAMLVYNGIFCIRIFSEIAQVGGDVELTPWLYGLLFFSYIPEILYMTIPMSFLFASLAAVSRLSADSEMIAPQSAGLSFWRISQGVILYGLMLSCITLYLANWIEPQMVRLRYQEYQHFLETTAKPNLNAGVLTTLAKRSVFYMDHVEDEYAEGFIYISQEAQKEKMTFAKKVEIYKEVEKGIRIKLTDGMEKTIDLTHHEGPQVFRFYKLNMDFPTPHTKAAQQFRGDPLDAVMSSTMIRILPRLKGENKIDYQVELLKRIAVPLACLIFSLFAVPLGTRNIRLGKSTGFGISLLLIVVYFVLSKTFKTHVVHGELSPVLGMSMPSLIFGVLGVLLQIAKHTWWGYRLNRIKDFFVIRASRWGQAIRLRFAFKSALDTGAWRTGLAPKAYQPFRFPRKIDIYIIKGFVSTFSLILGSLLALLLIIDYTQISNAVQKNEIGAHTVAKYLLYRVPEMIDYSLFFTVLVAVLVTLAVMSRNNEITAIRASGGSMKRLCVPLIVLGAGASLASYYLENFFLPTTNQTAFQLRNKIKNRNPVKFTNDVWLKTSQGNFLNFKYYDQIDSRIHSVVYYEIDYDGGGIITRVEMPQLVYHDNTTWKTEAESRGWTFSTQAESGEISARPFSFPANALIDLNIDRDDLAQKDVKPTEFSVSELRSYIAYLKSLGYYPAKEQTELFVRMAQPLLPLIMMLLALPLGFQFGRRGSFYNIAVGVIVGLSFGMFFELGRELGRNGMLPPAIAAWTVVAVFGMTAVYRFLQMES